MAKIAALKTGIASKLGITMRSVDRRIAAKADLTLQPREIAALMVAHEAGLSLAKFASDDEVAQVRQAIAGNASSAPSDAPAAKVTSTPVAARVARHSGSAPKRKPKGKKVFVVHGRNGPLRRAMFDFLKSVGLQPIEWSTALKATGSGTATIMQVIEVMLEKASGVVVLFTPDDLVKLKPELQRKGDPATEKELVGQARPNVLFEAGIALGVMPKETVLVRVGNVKDFSDVGGIHVMHMDNSPEARNTFVQKLGAANLSVDTSGTDWLDAGNFEQETYE